MMSEIDFSTKLTIWTKNIWVGKFNVKWHSIKDVPDNAFAYLRAEDNRHVTRSRDCTEVSFKVAIEMMKVIESYVEKSSILDVFEEFDKKEATVKTSDEDDDDRKTRRYGKREYHPTDAEDYLE